MAEELKKLALKLAKDGPVKVMPTPRLIQLLHNGTFFIKTTKASYVWEHPYYPQIYIPRKVLEEAATSDPNITLKETDPITREGTQIATLLSLQIGKDTKPITKILSFSSTSLPDPAKHLTGLVKIDFNSINKWFEETAPIFVHPKDPFKRIEILPSTRQITISVKNTVLASTTTSMHLYETGLPVRYYLPFTALTHPEWLVGSATKTECPYKGTAEYYSVDIGGEGEEVMEDLIWYYNSPLPESALVLGLVCFYGEKVDVDVDGERVERVRSHLGGGPDSEPPLF